MRATDIICARCSHPGRAGLDCASCGEDPSLEGRYRLLEVIGHGAIGTTYRAERLEDGEVFAVKEMLVRRFDSAKAMELFEREAAVLRALDHPGVPRYVDDFVAGSGKSVGFYLVQEFIDGCTLAEEVADRAPGTKEILDILEELAGILGYLHGRQPPVVHRDLKPSNIMRRPDGQLVLIDFGSVRRAVRAGEEGSTIAGTVGYMAPEQFYGRATPATDLYGLGMTAVALLTGKQAFELVEGSGAGSIDLAGLNVPVLIRELLEVLLAADPDARPGSPAKLRAMVARVRQGHPPVVQPLVKPSDREWTYVGDLQKREKKGGLLGPLRGLETIHVVVVGGLLIAGLIPFLLMMIEAPAIIAVVVFAGLVIALLSTAPKR